MSSVLLLPWSRLSFSPSTSPSANGSVPPTGLVSMSSYLYSSLSGWELPTIAIIIRQQQKFYLKVTERGSLLWEWWKFKSFYIEVIITVVPSNERNIQVKPGRSDSSLGHPTLHLLIPYVHPGSRDVHDVLLSLSTYILWFRCGKRGLRV